MILKRNSMFIERRADHDRRSSQQNNNHPVERRKRPDRRLCGLSVEIFDISDEEFREMFAVYIQ